MKQLATSTKTAISAAAAALIGLLPAFVAEAALTDIDTVPLASASSVSVKPNLLVTMDTSGSMGWDFMPDNVNPLVPNVNSADFPYTTGSPDYPYNQGYTCRAAKSGNNECMAGDPPYYTPQFNFVAYNPTFTYTPGVNQDGTSRGSQGAPWTGVLVNQYSGSATINLLNGFTEQVYQNSNSTLTFKRNGELYCPVPSATCFPGNVPPPQGGVTVTAFSYNTPAKPSITGVTISGFGNGTSVTGTTPSASAMAVGDVIDVVCTTSTPTSAAPFALANGVPVLTVSGNTFTFLAGQSWGTSTLSCSKATVNYSVVGYPEQADGSGNALNAGGSNWAVTVPGMANGATTGASNSSTKTVMVYSYNHGMIVGDVITVSVSSGGSTNCMPSTTTTTVTGVSLGTGTNAAVPVSFTYIARSNAACSGIYTIKRAAYNTLVSGGTSAYYFQMSPTEYCADQHLSYCVQSNVALAGYTNPANAVRYCNSAAAAAAAPSPSVPLTAPPATLPLNPSCQNKYMLAAGYVYPRFGQLTRTDIVPGNNAYGNGKYVARTDCSSGTCTYAQEMTNFANWYAYYRTRIQMMKTLVGQAFLNISSSYRIGFITINPGSNTNNPISSSNKVSASHYVPVSDFVTTQRVSFYNTLYSQIPANSTPLRSALARAGRYFAHQTSGINSGINDDPMQYSCQQNFVLLTTDGYWNTNLSNGDQEAVELDGSTAVGEEDSNPNFYVVPPPGFSAQQMGTYEGANCPAGNYNSGGCANTLADVAAYYYDTDLRTTALGNTSGALGTDVSTNNVPTTPADPANWQHMTTFTLGLADGLMTWQSNYAAASNGDFASIVNGSKGCWWPPVNGNTSTVCQWPVPFHDTPTALDDLWHAAVNGHGTYYHGTNPRSVANGLANALSGVNVRLAAAAASSTSSQQITPTNDAEYSTSYETQFWYGDLFAQTIDPNTGITNIAHAWDSNVTLNTQVGASSDSRTIYTLDMASKLLKPFLWSSLTTAEQSVFTNVCATPSNLTQCISLTSAQLNEINDGYDLLNYVRGQRGNEDGVVFRARTYVLGDAVDSQPLYVAGPPFAFQDTVSPTYGMFASANATRAPVVYVGANDGMLHAFDGQIGTGHNGAELWAYVPRSLWSKLYILADTNYTNLHQFYVDGSPVQMDAYFNGAWHTVLLGGMNSGGHSYYALDVTNPTTPIFLWEFCSNSAVCTVSDPDLGLTYGNPVITKRASDGRWVALVTSGYNNVSTPTTPTSGQEFLYILDLATGQILQKIATGAGTATTPGGLAKISAWADNGNQDNTAKYVYGGDLLGNIWRFDLTVSPAAVMKLGTLVDASSNPQPVTTSPELGSIQGYRVVFVATGEYLGTSDVTNTNTQSLYAFKDLGINYGNLRTGANLVKQTIINVDASDRTTSTNAVDWSQSNGWYVDFPTAGERVNLNPQLALGTLEVKTNIPSTGACTVGGSSWNYEFNFLTGSYVPTAQGGILGTYNSSAIAVGFVIVQLPSGALKSIGTDATAAKQTQGVNVGNSPLNGKRVGWRQL